MLKISFRLIPFKPSRFFVLFILSFLIVTGLTGRAMAVNISSDIEAGGPVAGNAGTVDTFLIDNTNDGEAAAGGDAAITLGTGNAGLTISSNGLDAQNNADQGLIGSFTSSDNTGTATLTLNDATNGDFLRLLVIGDITGDVGTDANDLNIIVNATATNDAGGSQLTARGDITLGAGTVTLNSDADDIAILNFNGSGAQAMNGIINGSATGEGQVINAKTGGTLTFNSNIGSGTSVDRVRLDVNFATAFNGTISAATDVDLNNTNTTTFNGSVTTASFNFKQNGTAVIGTGSNITGAVNNTTTNEGTLTLSGTTTISSTVGSTGVGLLQINAGANSSTATFNGLVKTTSLTTNGTGNIAINAGLTGNLNFATAATVTIADGFDLTGTVTNANSNQGILNVSGTSTFSGDVGSTTAGLNAVNIQGSGKTATFAGDLMATTTTISNLATLTFTKAATTVTGAITAAGTTGTLNVSTATVTPTGTVTLGANSTLAVTIGTTNGQLVSTALTGLTLASGTTIAPTVSGTLVAGDITIVQNNDNDVGLGADVTTGINITDNSSAFNFSLKFTGNNLVLTVTSDGSTGFGSNASAINEVTSTAFASDTTLNNALNGLSGTVKEAALETLAPVVSGGAVVGAISAGHAISNTVSVRIASLRTGISAGQGLSAGDEINEDKHFWFQGFGTYADQGTRQGVTGFTSVTGGFGFGSDKQISNDLVLGLAGSFAYSDVNASLSQNRTTVESYQGTAYGSYELGKYFIDAQVGLAYNDYNGDRFINIGAVERTAHADYDGYQVSGKVEVGREMSLPKEVKFTPSIGLAYTHVGIPEYTETGASVSNLNVNGQDYDILNVSFRGEFRRTYEVNEGSLTPEVHLGYNYEAFDNNIQNISSFTGGGNNFQTTGFDPENHTFLGGLGVTFESDDNFDFVATYDLESKTDYSSHSLLLKGRWSF